MHAWRLRRRLAGVQSAPLTPAQVQALRAHGHRVTLWSTRSYIAASALGSLNLGLFAIFYDHVPHTSLVLLGFGNAVVFALVLIFTWRGYAKEAGLLTLVVSVLSILVICSELSSDSSVESLLFGLAVIPFVLLRSAQTMMRLGLTFFALGVYVACELSFPGGQGLHELAADDVAALATFNRIAAALLMASALTVLQIKLGLNRRILEGAARYGELRATTDELTGVYNRRPVIAQLEEYAARGRGNFAIALIDLDNFKSVNDTHGHDCGDAIIRLVAESLQSHFRASDMVSRWGGDEFLVLMPGIRHGDLQPVLERLRATIAELRQPCGGHLHTVTVSIGAAMGAIDQNPDECIASADHALYRAKEEGRNRVVTVGASRETAALGRS